MTDLTFSMPDGREETNKQTNKQTQKNLAGYFQKKPEDSPQQYLIF